MGEIEKGSIYCRAKFNYLPV